MAVSSINPCPPDTIRMTVEIQVPHDEKIMNYGHVAKQTIRDYINSDKLGSFTIVNGPDTRNKF